MDELDLLLEGNSRFMKKFSLDDLRELAKGQKPYAVIVACSDSRVPPEVIFDEQRLGRLFVVRVAGNVAQEPSVQGSVEYAVEHLGARLLVVLGHTGCGAVSASFEKELSGEVAKLVKFIRPAAEASLETTDPEERMRIAVKKNVENQAAALRKNDVVSQAINMGKLDVVAMLYHLEDGKVEVL